MITDRDTERFRRRGKPVALAVIGFQPLTRAAC